MQSENNLGGSIDSPKQEKIDKELVLQRIKSFMKQYAMMDFNEIEMLDDKYLSENHLDFQVDSTWFTKDNGETFKDKILAEEAVIKINKSELYNNRVNFSINGIVGYSIGGKLFDAIKSGRFEE